MGITKKFTEERLAELVAEDIRAAKACHDWCVAKMDQDPDFCGFPPDDLCYASERAEIAVRDYRRAMREALKT